MKQSERDRLTIMEQKLTDLEKSNSKDHSYICEKIIVMDKKLDKFIDSAEKKFAPKWVGDVVKYGIYTALVAGLGVFIYLLQTHIK